MVTKGTQHLVQLHTVVTSSGACIPMQVQDDGVVRSQSILIPHLVLPLGILPPDRGNGVPDSNSDIILGLEVVIAGVIQTLILWLF